jgi:hypothetical protein
MNIYEKLQAIQMELDVPKSQFNSFGKYHYRSCEDILAAVKPVAGKHNCVVKVFDEMVEVGGRCYVKATARLVDCEELTAEEATGFAREEETKKGMDAAQITGAASSYARKYALNGLFCLDDVKDADYNNKHDHGSIAVDPDAIDTEGLILNDGGCSVCGNDMTSGQMTLSMKKHGKLLCPDCQKQ